MSAPTFPAGTRFRHPTQGECTVTRSSGKAVRYTFPARVPGFGPQFATTSPHALAAVIGAGIIELLED